MSEELLSTKEAARYLGVHEKQLYMLIKEKRIPATRVTGKWIFPRALLDEWLLSDARKNIEARRGTARTTGGRLLAAGSDDPALAILAGELRKADPDAALFLASTGSTEGLKALNRGDVDLSFSHLFDPAAREYNVPYLAELVPDRPVVAVNLFRRETGFVVAQGNPKHIRRFQDLGKKGVRIVNRQAGSGTRQLLEQELARAGVPWKTIAGWDREASTHYEVALAVQAKEADVGVASASAAHLMGLEFLPQREERFDMVLDRSTFFERRFQTLLERLASAPLRRRLEHIGGYDFRECGKVLTRKA